MPGPTRPTVDLDRRLTAEEQCRAAANVVARYFELCDVPGPTGDVRQALAGVFTADATWVGRGEHYGQEFGRAEGREAVLDLVCGYLPPSPHFHRNVHLLTSPQLDGRGDDVVRGRWVLQQLSTDADGRQELRCARIEAECVVDGDGARIASFSTERLFDTALPPAVADDPQTTNTPTRRIPARNAAPVGARHTDTEEPRV